MLFIKTHQNWWIVSKQFLDLWHPLWQWQHQSDRIANSGVARTFPGGRLAHPESQNEEENKECLRKKKKNWWKFEEKWGKWNSCPPGDSEAGYGPDCKTPTMAIWFIELQSTKTSKLKRQLTGGFMRLNRFSLLRTLEISYNSPKPGGTASQQALVFWSRPLTFLKTLLSKCHSNWTSAFLCTLSICKVYYFASFYIFFVETFVKGKIFLRPLWPFDHVLNIMLCFLCLFVLMYDIWIKFDMIWYHTILTYLSKCHSNWTILTYLSKCHSN